MNWAGKLAITVVVVGAVAAAIVLGVREATRRAPLTEQGVTFTFLTESGEAAEVSIDGTSRGSMPLMLTLAELRPMLRREISIPESTSGYREVSHHRPEDGHAFVVGVAMAQVAPGEVGRAEDDLLVVRAMLDHVSQNGMASLRIVGADDRVGAYSRTEFDFAYSRHVASVNFTFIFTMPDAE